MAQHRTTGLGAIALALVIVAPSVARADGVTWRTDVKAAAREAVESNKPMLLKFTADWCTYCHKMERTTYRDASVARNVNRNFIPVKVDADQHEELTKALGIKALPTTVIVSPKMQVLSRIAGYKTAEALSPLLADVVQVNHEVPANAFGGYCLVTLRAERRLQLGDPEITKEFRGRTVAFASQKALAEFERNPVYYWPVWDGHCPVTAIDNGERVEGIPSTGAIYRDRLWFFANRSQRSAFDETPTDYLPTSTAGRPSGSRN